MRGIIIIIVVIIFIILILGSLSEPQLFAKCLDVTLGDSPGTQGDSPIPPPPLLHTRAVCANMPSVC